jgi:hypothetical protein
MRDRDHLSVSEKLLLAAYELEESGRRPFSAEDLVVGAWRRFPDTFGLAGYRGEDDRLLYPDSNRVFAEIMGAKPIRQRGLLVKVGNKMYQLTEAGRDHARLLSARLGAYQLEKGGLAREIQRELQRLFASKGTEKHRNGRSQDITFHDACAFWGISPRSSAIEMEGRMANLLRIVEAARAATRGRSVTFDHGGQSYSASDLDELLRVHNDMLKRFAAEVLIIRKRTRE